MCLLLPHPALPVLLPSPWRFLEKQRDSLASPQTYWIRIWILTRSLGDSQAHESLRSTALNHNARLWSKLLGQLSTKEDRVYSLEEFRAGSKQITGRRHFIQTLDGQHYCRFFLSTLHLWPLSQGCFRFCSTPQNQQALKKKKGFIF